MRAHLCTLTVLLVATLGFRVAQGDGNNGGQHLAPNSNAGEWVKGSSASSPDVYHWSSTQGTGVPSKINTVQQDSSASLSNPPSAYSSQDTQQARQQQQQQYAPASPPVSADSSGDSQSTGPGQGGPQGPPRRPPQPPQLPGTSTDSPVSTAGGSDASQALATGQTGTAAGSTGDRLGAILTAANSVASAQQALSQASTAQAGTNPWQAVGATISAAQAVQRAQTDVGAAQTAVGASPGALQAVSQTISTLDPSSSAGRIVASSTPGGQKASGAQTGTGNGAVDAASSLSSLIPAALAAGTANLLGQAVKSAVAGRRLLGLDPEGPAAI